MPLALGIDSSNYTTSLAFYNGQTGVNVGKLLEVPDGALGLRQSDALFQHIKRLPELMEQLNRERGGEPIVAVSASMRPREVEGSYMPCFLAGESQGRVLSQALEVPFYPCSHQQGHLAAAAWSAGDLSLLDRPHLAWHLSGGTTELLHVEPNGLLVKARQIGGSNDLAAGQLIDRTGKALGLSFPGGKAVDALSRSSDSSAYFPTKVKACSFSLSGLENKMREQVERGDPPGDICRYVLSSLIVAVERATEQALEAYPGLPVLYAGGVASNQLLRDRAGTTHRALFAKPEFSTDNAMGVAILAWRQFVN